jgi:hypothetical protein
MKVLMLPIVVAMLASGSPLTAQADPDTIRWTIVIGSRHAGVYKRWIEADGELRYFMEFDDRGRGPRMETHLRLGPGGLPVWLASTGHDYFKASLASRFSIRNDTARWEIQQESGEMAVSGPVFFTSGGVDDGLMIGAALAHGGELQLVPEGRIRVERVGELQVRAGERTRSVVQYEISGKGFEPQTTWLTPEGRYFASGSGWSGTVEIGWEETLPQILQAQEARRELRHATAARRLARRPTGPLVFRNISIYDADARTILRNQSVVVSGNRISAVGDDISVPVPAGAEVVDGYGRTLLPGLWDMHTHNNLLDGPMHLAAGITSVRDLGNDTTIVVDLHRKWESGETLGPRLITSGFIDGPGPFAGPTGLKASTEAEARAAVDTYARLGMEQIKVYSSLDPALLPVIIEQAHQHDMRVSGHIPWPLLAEQAVRRGIDELQHANFLVLNFLGDTIDTRTPARFNAPASMTADLDLTSAPVQEFVQLLKERDVVIDPTVAIFEGLLTARAGEPTPGFESVIHRFPPDVRRQMKGGGLPVPEGMDERYRASFGKMLDFVALLHRTGIRIVPGTDSWAGFTLHRELELYVQAGIPITEVLYLATLGSARIARRDDRLGSISVGKLADLVMVEGDPSLSISDLRRTRLVVKDGVVYDPNALYAEFNIGPVP